MLEIALLSIAHAYQQVLDSVINSQAITCPTREVTELKRETLRFTKCQAPSITTADELVNFIEGSVIDASDLHSEAYVEVIRKIQTAEEPFTCPFEFPIYESCDIDADLANGFTPSDALPGNISYNGLGIILAPDVMYGDLSMLISNQVMHCVLCYIVSLSQYG